MDKRITKARARKKKQDQSGLPPDRLAHKECNTKEGFSDPIVAWPEHLIVVELVSIIAADRSHVTIVARLETRQPNHIHWRPVSHPSHDLIFLIMPVTPKKRHWRLVWFGISNALTTKGIKPDVCIAMLMPAFLQFDNNFSQAPCTPYGILPGPFDRIGDVYVV